MPSGSSANPIYQFKNCHILQDHQIIQEDFWVRNGKILNPEKLFYEERAHADVQVDCGGNIIAPGYIDVQINGDHGILLHLYPVYKQVNSSPFIMILNIINNVYFI